MATMLASSEGPIEGRGYGAQAQSPVVKSTPNEGSIRHIALCLDGSEMSDGLVGHGAAVARALGAPLTLLHVLESAGSGANEPPDPVDWEIRRQEAHERLEDVAKGQTHAGDTAAEVIEGRPAEQICNWAQHHDVDLTVLCTHGESGATRWSLASTARKLVEAVPGSLLLVPPPALSSRPVAKYRRILVPLDGSPLAESVLPVAQAIARDQGAELVLAHVVPVPELTEIGPPDERDIELRERLVHRNESVVTDYLDRLRARLSSEDGIALRVAVVRGDVRHRLAQLIEQEDIDLVVLSARGRSDRSDLPCGTVTASLIANVKRPLLMMRGHPARAALRAAAAAGGEARLRLPGKGR